jgi:hypothetical protein
MFRGTLYLVCLVVITLTLISCNDAPNNEASEPTRVPPIRITVVGNVGSASDIVECSEPPEGLTVKVESIGNNEIKVDITGLNVGEIPTLEMRTTTNNGGTLRTIQHQETVGSAGTYTFLERVDARSLTESNVWIIRVIHERGAACVSILF